MIKFFFKIILLILFFQSNAFSEDIFKSLISTYINNKELNSQREKTKATNETLVQSYSVFKPTVTGEVSHNDYLNESRRDETGASIADSNLQTKKKSIKVEQKILQGIPSVLAAKTDVKIAKNQLKNVEQNVLLKAIEAYTAVLSSKRKVDITRDN